MLSYKTFTYTNVTQDLGESLGFLGPSLCVTLSHISAGQCL